MFTKSNKINNIDKTNIQITQVFSQSIDLKNV